MARQRRSWTEFTSFFGEKEDEPDREKPINPPFEPLDTSDIVLPGTSFFVNEILHFEECIRTQSEPINSWRDNIESMKVVLGILDRYSWGTVNAIQVHLGGYIKAGADEIKLYGVANNTPAWEPSAGQKLACRCRG